MNFNKFTFFGLADIQKKAFQIFIRWINQTLAVSSLAMLARLLRYGQIAYHGGFYNAETGRMAPLKVEPIQFATMRRAAKKQTSKSAARGKRAAG